MYVHTCMYTPGSHRARCRTELVTLIRLSSLASVLNRRVNELSLIEAITHAPENAKEFQLIQVQPQLLILIQGSD